MTTATRERFAMADLTGGELNALVKKVGGANQVRHILRDETGVVITNLTPTIMMVPGRVDSIRETLEKALAVLVKPELGDKAWHGSLNERLLEVQRLLNAGFPKLPANMQVWKTIKLGTGPKNADDFRKAIKAAGMKISDWGNDILGKPAFKVSDTEQDVDLVVATPKELGFSGNATYRDICNKAIELGLELCPAEVGPQLRKQYTDQPKDEWLVVAMEPITDSYGDLYVFRVGLGYDGLWLYAYYGDPDFVWYADSRFVFVRRK